jgi:hypothetical protein
MMPLGMIRELCRPTALAVIALAMLIPLRARSQDRDHDGGFFLRLSAGGGGAATEATEQGGGRFRYSGPAGDINFAVGGIVSPNLALHGTLFGWSITDPDIEVAGATFNGTGELTLAGIGGGVTYYFMPANVYLSGSFGIGRLEYTEGNLTGRSSSGVIFDATVGKEWWVGDSWGLGAALGLGLHSIPESGLNDNWSGGSVTLRFTATLN